MNVNDVLGVMNEVGIPGFLLSATLGMAIPWFNTEIGWKMNALLRYLTPTSTSSSSEPVVYRIVKEVVYLSWLGYYTTLYGYLGAWHFSLLLGPFIRYAKGSTPDIDYLTDMAMIEWRIVVYYGPTVIAATWRLLWIYRGLMAMIAATLAAVWFCLPFRYGRYFILQGVVWIGTTHNMNDLNIRGIFLSGHDKFVATFNHWEVEKAKAAKEEMPVLSPYTYTPLESPRHIRVLRLNRRSLFQPPSCELVHVSLDESPSYEAISYTW